MLSPYSNEIKIYPFSEKNISPYSKECMYSYPENLPIYLNLVKTKPHSFSCLYSLKNQIFYLLSIFNYA